MPDALELPGTRRPVVIEVCAGLALIRELVPNGIPCLPAVVGALDNLPEPTGVLGRIDPVGVSRRPLDVVDVPAGEVRSADVPLLALGIRGHHECALVRANQYPNSAHASLLPESSFHALREYGTAADLSRDLFVLDRDVNVVGGGLRPGHRRRPDDRDECEF